MVFPLVLAVGVYLDTGILLDIVAQVQGLALPALGQIAHQQLFQAVLPVEEVFKELLEIRSDTEEMDKLLKNGNPFRSRAVKDVKNGDKFRVYHSDGTFIGVFKYDEEKHMYYPEKIFLGGN